MRWPNPERNPCVLYLLYGTSSDRTAVDGPRRPSRRGGGRPVASVMPRRRPTSVVPRRAIDRREPFRTTPSKQGAPFPSFPACALGLHGGEDSGSAQLSTSLAAAMADERGCQMENPLALFTTLFDNPEEAEARGDVRASVRQALAAELGVVRRAAPAGACTGADSPVG